MKTCSLEKTKAECSNCLQILSGLLSCRRQQAALCRAEWEPLHGWKAQGCKFQLNVSISSFPPWTYLLFNNKIILDSVILSKQPILYHQKFSLPQISGVWKPLLKGLKVCWCVYFSEEGLYNYLHLSGGFSNSPNKGERIGTEWLFIISDIKGIHTLLTFLSSHLYQILNFRGKCSSGVSWLLLYANYLISKICYDSKLMAKTMS